MLPPLTSMCRQESNGKLATPLSGQLTTVMSKQLEPDHQSIQKQGLAPIAAFIANALIRQFMISHCV